MDEQHEVVTKELGIVFKSADQGQADEFGRWFRDRTALGVIVRSADRNVRAISYPVNG